MRRLKLGEPLQPGVTGFEEGVHYNYTAGGHTLTLSVRHPGASEIYAVGSGHWEFALSARDEAIFILTRFDDCPWRMADYNWWINPPMMRPDPDADLAGIGEGLPVSVCLVDAATGLVKALRLLRLSQEFGLLLLEQVELQTRRAFDPCHYLDLVMKTRSTLNDTNKMVAEAICVCSQDWEFQLCRMNSIRHVVH